MTQDDFEKQFSQGNNELFVWLTKDRTRAKLSRNRYRNAVIDLTVFPDNIPVQEAVIDFVEGKLNLVTLSIHNRGDGGEITREAFSERFLKTGKAVGGILGVSPRRRDADSRKGLLTEGFAWYSQKLGIALLEHNEGAMKDGDLEFLRLRMTRPRPKGPLAASMAGSRGGTTARLDDLPENLSETEEGDVFISNLPMVDQGDKGYCVVASTQRVFEYYGIGADMHQIAEIAEADPESGTSSLLMAKELDKIDYRFKTRLEIIGMGPPGTMTEVDKSKGEYYVGKPVDERKFLKEIRSYIDVGLPLLWALELGLYPEKPQLTPQTSGGHMRIIIGYNDSTGEIIFSDSWGAGHEFKKMKMSDAYRASHGLFVLKPTTIAVEYVSEMIVIVSLMSLGLSIDRAFSWREWKQVLPLLLVTMPLCIAAVAFLGYWAMGLSVASAVLLGACLSPTDPVLARAVQVGPPGDSDRDDVRFNLSTEAGFNDSLAFPFVYLAIALTTMDKGWLTDWLAVDVLWRILAGVGIGLLVGKTGAWLAFRKAGGENKHEHGIDEGSEGLLVISTLFLAYGLGEIVHGYGFLSVFVAAVTAKQREIESDLHKKTHGFIDQIERLILVIILIGFGGLLASGVLNTLTWPIALVGIAFLVIVRPFFGWISLAGSELPGKGKMAVAFLGVRGIGSFYYLSYGQHHADFTDIPELWAAISFTVLVSIVLHGITASRLLQRLGDEERVG
eukprot:g3486.t1